MSQEAEFAGQELSGWWRRAAAWTVDAFLVSSGFVMVYAFLFAFFSGSLGTVFLLLVLSFAVLVPALYWGLFMQREGDHNGQSPGKQIFEIRVVREDGEPVDFFYAVRRQVFVMQMFWGFFVALFTFGTGPFLNYLWPLWDERRQALHDKMVASRVTRAS